MHMEVMVGERTPHDDAWTEQVERQKKTEMHTHAWIHDPWYQQ